MLGWTRGLELALCVGLAFGCVDAAAPLRTEQRRSLTLLHSSDVHSRVWPFRTRVSEADAAWGLGPSQTLVEVGGFARLGGIIERERQRGPLLWLDSGDALEGSEIFRRFGGKVELGLLSGLGLGAMALGNHELSLPAVALAERLRQGARFPVLSSNLRPVPGSPLAGLLLPSVVLQSAGFRVGVIGVANTMTPPAIESFENAWQLVTTATNTAVQGAIDAIAQRADLVVVLSHGGLDVDRSLVRATTGVDLVLGGHQHLVTVQPEWQRDCEEPSFRERRPCRSRSVPIVHSGAYGKLLSRLTLELAASADGRGLDIEQLELEQLATGPGAPESAAVAARLESLWPSPQAPLAFLTEPLWRRSALGGDSPLGNLVADAMRDAAGADVAILNSSTLRTDLEADALLRSDLDLALPFDEPWLLLWLSGRELRAGLERAARSSAARGCQSSVQLAGLRVVLRCDECRVGSSACLTVERMTPFGALPLDDDERLQVVLPAYLAQSGANFAGLAGSGTSDAPGPVSDVVAQYVSGGLVVASPATLTDCVADLQALSPTRCRAAFGLVGCPVARDAAVHHCQRLPQLGGGRDERILALP